MKSPALLLLQIVLAFQLSAQSSFWGRGIRGEGSMTEKNLDITDFNSIRMDVNADVFLTQGTNYKVTAIGQRNILDLLDTQVNQAEWAIRFTETVGKYERLEIYITMPELTGVQIRGLGDIEGKSKFTGLNELKLEVSGMGNIRLNVEASQVTSKVSGMGDIFLEGHAGNLSGSITGSGDLKAQKLEANEVSLAVSGMGDCEVTPVNSLSVKISGIGSVYYSGKPKHINQTISGIGKMRSL